MRRDLRAAKAILVQKKAKGWQIMKRGKAVVASAAFVGLALTKMLFPDVGASVRTRLQAALERDPDYVTVFRELGSRLSLRRGEAMPEETGAPAQAQQPARAQYVSYYIEDGDAQGETERPQETQTPEVVTAFLERQAAFADQTLPEQVDYDYMALPFDYALPVAGRTSSGFGFRLHPILHTVRFHYGTDVAAASGESIAAFADGTVTFAGHDDSFGWHLKVDHGDGWVSHYCHCSKLLVKEGDAVSRGDTIALVGATGLATGPHLHFELTHNGVFLNPEYYLNA